MFPGQNLDQKARERTITKYEVDNHGLVWDGHTGIEAAADNMVVENDPSTRPISLKYVIDR